MSKYTCRLRGDFDQVLRAIDREIGGSISATLEASGEHTIKGVRCAVRVYERYSWTGGNRVSANITLMGDSDEMYLIAIASGGSQAVFFKINRFGEDAFLEKVANAVEHFRAGR